jgi:hypothetical protein
MTATAMPAGLEDMTETCVASPEVATRLEPASREDLERIERRCATHALLESVDPEAELVALRHRGRVLWARPIDTRRFIRAMAPYVCFN